MKRLLLVCLLLLIAQPVFSATYYVNKAGSNSNSCGTATSTTDSSAKLTIAAGAGCLAAGDTLLIGDGTYAEGIGDLIPSGVSDGVRTIVRAENNRMVILTGSASNYVIHVQNRQYITIDGLVLDATTAQLSGIAIGDNVGGFGGAGSSYVTFQNGEVKNAQYCVNGHQSGSTILSHHISILNNLIHNCGNTLPLFEPFEAHGIYPGWHTSLIDRNTVYAVGNNDPGASGGGAAIHQYYSGLGGLDNNVISNNVVRDNYGVGILIRDGDDALVYNNVVYNNALLDEGAGGIFVGDGTGARVYFNTFYDNNGVGIWIFGGSSAIVRNNISYLNGGAAYTDGGSGTTASNNLTTNPSFTNATGGDFHLSASSAALPPCGVAGTGVTVDKDGITRPSPPSCGAYEVPSGSDPGSPLLENFESYAVTTNINGLNGGTGWTQNWQLTEGTATVETAACLTGKAFRTTATTATTVRRFFTAKSGEFTFQLKMCSSVTNGNDYYGFTLHDQDASFQVSVYFFGANIIYSAASVGTVLSSFTANTSYRIRVNFDTVNQPGKARIAVNDNPYGSWIDTSSSFTSIGMISIASRATNAHSLELDDINDDAGPPMLPPAPVTAVGIRARIRGRI